jgi:hypothetical protein
VGCPSRPNIRNKSQARTWLVTSDISFDPDSAIDRDHLEQAKRTTGPGWTEASRSCCSCRARSGMLSCPGHCPAGKARHPM